jgi:redox-sensitive bicupin YhaK (pirin superfamily)
MGHEEVLGPNEIQRMSAGTGVTHSEYNASQTEPLHFFQIWIEPATDGTQPSYEDFSPVPSPFPERLRSTRTLRSSWPISRRAPGSRTRSKRIAPPGCTP